MLKSKFRDDASPYGDHKYVHTDISFNPYGLLLPVDWFNYPYFFTRLPLPSFALAQNDSQAETLPARSIMQITAIRVRGVLKITDHSASTYCFQSVPFRIDLVMEDQEYLGRIAERCNTSDLSDFYLRERVSTDPQKRIDVSCTVNSPLDTADKGHAVILRSEHIKLLEMTNQTGTSWRSEPFQYIDFEVEIPNSIFEVPAADLISGVTSLESCVGRMPSIYLVFIENAIKQGSTAICKFSLHGRLTVSYAILDNMGVSTY